MVNLKKPHVRQTPLEEWLNALSHGFGFILAIIAVGILLFYSLGTHQPKIVTSCVVYGVTLAFMFLASTLYHHHSAIPLLKLLDHASIYLLIAGTYTPFVLVDMPGTWGIFLFISVWTLAIASIVFKIFFIERFAWFSVLTYLLMGWLILIAIKPFVEDVPMGAIAWLLAGGLSYTFGVIFYVLDGRYYFFHLLWHIFVIIGSFLQFAAVLLYIA